MEQVGRAAAGIVNVWAWWQGALKDPNAIGTAALPVSDGDPQQGYFRVKTKTGGWEPVAIWQKDGHWFALRNGNNVGDVGYLWNWACRNPISHAAYKRAMDGNGWEDEPEAAPSIGHNSGEADAFENLRISFLGEKEMIEEFMKKPITAQEQADKCGIWGTRLRDLRNKAENERKVEKQPHLDACREVDAKWNDGIIKNADAVLENLRAHLKPWLDKKKAENERKARAEREEAERLRREAEAKALEEQRAREEAEVGAGAVDPMTLNEVADQHEEERAALLKRAQDLEKSAKASEKVSAGRTGSRMGIRTIKVGVITDWQKAAEHLVGIKNEKVCEAIQSVANASAKSGLTFPGMEIGKEDKVA